MTKAPKPMTGGGEVDLVIHEQMKGVPAKTAKARENGSCTAGFYNVHVGKMAKPALVFVGANGEAVGYWSGVAPGPAEEWGRRTSEASRRGSAHDDAARATKRRVGPERM